MNVTPDRAAPAPLLGDADAESVAAAYDLGPVRSVEGPTARGEGGWVFALTTDRGRFAVRRAIHPADESEALEDLGFVTAVRAAGVAAPALLETRRGTVLLELASGQVRVSTWVDLLDPDLRLDPAAVGAAVAGLHRCGYHSDRPLHPWYSEPVGAARWDELVRELAAAGAPFAGDLAELRDEIVAIEALLTPMTDVITCHRDLFADNVRATTGGEICVIDWDNHGPADPGQELAFVLGEFGSSPERARTLVAAYRAAGGPGRVRRPGDFSMLIATLGHINERACARWLAHPPGDPERERMAARFAEFSDNPVTRGSIADLLDAVAGV